MKKVKLGEVCEIVTGSTPKSTNPDYWNGEYKWITPAEISDDDFIIVDTQRKISKLGIEKTGLKSFPMGTVLLSSRAPIGKVAIAGCEMYCNQGFKNFICSNEINNEYLYYFLKSRKNFLNNIGRGATFKEISKSIISNIEIILSSYDVQCTQTQNLKKIDNLIYLRKKVIKEYQLLVKSRFNEMFGDPVLNEMGWEKHRLSKLTLKIGSGATPRGGRESYVNEGIALIRSMNVYDGKFILKDLAYLTNVQAEKLNNVIVESDDVLLNITGASVSRCCIVPQIILPARVNQHVSIIRCKKHLLSPIFLNQLLITSEFKSLLQKIGESSGATRQAITKNQIEELTIPLPPLSLQNEFADFVGQVDKSQLAIQKSLEELETLKKSLMQEYFG